ncbi:MAG: hypothetical protein HN416_15320 [Nitrospina sp.]|jgi:hypothetical protein|nr:hypothetical protein [Nitrospina sp.]
MKSIIMNFLSVRNVLGCLISACLAFSLQTAYAKNTEGIPIQKDVYLGSEIFGVEDLPNEITVSLYASESATKSLATQTFSRGNYTVDFEFNKSDGVDLGPIARLNVNFTNQLDMGDDLVQVKEIWAELSVNDVPVGERMTVSDETLVQLLLASDASIATYLTLAYDGDNPITTIYKDLPLSTLSSSGGTSANEYISSLFSLSSVSDGSIRSPTSPFWELSGTSVNYSDGNVGVGTGATVPFKFTVVNAGATETPSFANYSTMFFNTGSTYFGFRNTTDNLEGIFGVGGGSSGRFGLGTASNHAMEFFVNSSVVMMVDTSGRLGIGTQAPGYNLAVNGTIGCKELTVTSTGWADFVFEENYNLPPLSEVEAYISSNGHLPGIPTEAEVKEKGVSVGDMSAKLLQKVEELTLYVIDLKKENDSLKGQLATIQNQIGD